MRLTSLAALAYCLALFLWFGVEDSSFVYAAALGAGAALLIVGRAARGTWRDPPGAGRRVAPAEGPTSVATGMERLHTPGEEVVPERHFTPGGDAPPGRLYKWLAKMAAIGLMAGTLAPLLALALVLVKIALHGHPTPEFALDEVLALLWRTPYWGGAGLLAGLGAGLLRLGARARRTQL